jgi:hypothetical protein
MYQKLFSVSVFYCFMMEILRSSSLVIQWLIGYVQFLLLKLALLHFLMPFNLVSAIHPIQSLLCFLSELNLVAKAFNIKKVFFIITSVTELWT